nr:aromatic acid exporter family protein [uncultured Blautia sp.]
MAFGVGPQEMLDRAQVPDKWQLTPLKNFKSPRIRSRMWRTALAALITVIIYEYILNKRNPCFALIGAVYGVGSQFEEGFHNGINRVIGTLVGGLLVIPFYELYIRQLFGIPDWIWLVLGLCLVLWCNFALGADSAIQPGSVIYFVVIYTVGTERVLPYTIARIIDTGVGVLIALLVYAIFPSKYDRENGVSIKTFWAETKESFKSYINKNRTLRKKERENFGTDDEKFSKIISRFKDRPK